MQPFWILLQGGIYVFQTKVLYQSFSRLKGIDATKRQIEFLNAKEQIHKLCKQEHEHQSEWLSYGPDGEKTNNLDYISAEKTQSSQYVRVVRYWNSKNKQENIVVFSPVNKI